jgi:hypothetical protein|tara:strand:- start:104 stop:259 length:156 start_codon:yes stop_codon:yes gene_type:complete
MIEKSQDNYLISWRRLFNDKIIVSYFANRGKKERSFGLSEEIQTYPLSVDR